MSNKPDDNTRIVDEELWKEFEEYRKWKDGRGPDPLQKVEKPKRWRCDICGRDLGPADWDKQRLSRAHPDGCPKCGSTKADIG